MLSMEILVLQAVHQPTRSELLHLFLDLQVEYQTSRRLRALRLLVGVPLHMV